jgi:folate-binding protein YgfZ
VIADLVVLVDEAQLVVALPRSVAGELRVTFERHLIMEDAEIAPAAFDVLWAHGPKADAVLRAARNAGARGAVLDRTGLGGAVMFLAPDAAPQAREAIEAAVRDADGVVGDEAGWEALRLSHGVPRFGLDFDASTYPQEAGLEKSAVSFSKGCYLGQEVVCMLELRGHVKRKLVQLAIEGDAPVRGAEVTDAEGAGANRVGEVTSAGLVPGRGAIALAMVKRQLAQPGTELRVAGSPARVLGERIA